METIPPPASHAADALQRYVRVRRWRTDGFVEFDFALGDPELSMELILPRASFEAFCQLPGTRTISEAQAAHRAALEHAYLYGEPGPHTGQTAH